MRQQASSQAARVAEVVRQEHELKIDRVIEVPEDQDPKAFFDGLLDVLIEYVEQHRGLAGLGMSHVAGLAHFP